MESTISYLFWSTTTLAVSFSLFYVYAKYKFSYWSKRGVKSPPTHIIFGNFKDVFLMRKEPRQFMQDIYDFADRDDPYIGFYIFHEPALLLRNHDLIKTILVTNFDNFSTRRFGSYYGKDMLGLVNLLSVNSLPIWKYLRCKLSPILNGQKLKSMVPFIVSCEERMLNYIDKLPINEKKWSSSQDSLELTSYYVNDVLTNLVFGVNIDSFTEKNNAFIQTGQKVFRGFASGIGFIIYFFYPRMTCIIDLFAFKGIMGFFRKRFKKSVQNKTMTNSKRDDILDLLLALKDGEQDPIFKFNEETLLAQALSFQLAGFEATSTATAFTIYNLASYPEYQDQLYDEIQEHLSGKELSLDILKEMSFLDNVVNEALRLHPPLPTVDRITTKDFKVPNTGLVIEKDVPIYVSVNSINQDAKYFTNPLKFDPFRTKATNKKFYESLVFGLGPRMCVGQRLGGTIVKVILIALVSNYIFVQKPTEKDKNTYKTGNIFPYLDDGLNVQFKKREKCI